MKLGSTAFALALTFGVTIAVVACGGDEAEEKRQAAAKVEADEQEAFLDVYCQIILPCCNKILSANIDDVAGCKTRLRALDPVTIASKVARDACTAQAKKVQFEPKFCPDFAHAQTPACPDASRKDLIGLKKPGEVCATSKDCAPDFTGTVSCAAGVCQLRKRGADGDGDCDRTIDGDVVIALPNPAESATVFDCYRVPEGLQCNPITKKCAKPVAEKGTCKDDGECAKTHFCVNEEGNPRICLTRLGAGQRCETDSECKGKCEDNICTDAIEESESCSTTRNCKDGLECSSSKCTKPGPDARLAPSCK